MRSVILASESPRRRELMNISGISFSCASPKIEEHLDLSNGIEEGVMKLAKEKAEAVYESHGGYLVIGADTIVVIGDEILGKPKDSEDARRMLRLLSGKTHKVITGVALVNQEVHETFYEVTDVTFCELSDQEIDDYIKSREHYDKAGSYAIQGKGMMFVKRIEGDYANVVGLPMCHLVHELKKYVEI